MSYRPNKYNAFRISKYILPNFIKTNSANASDVAQFYLKIKRLFVKYKYI